MDYNALLEFVTELGYRLAVNGAETYRVEESANRILDAYGIKAEAFAIPNYLVISIETPDGKPMTRMRRIGHQDKDLDAVERYSNLSRKICTEKPDPQLAAKWLDDVDKAKRLYPFPLLLIGYFFAGAGFSIFFGGTIMDSICGGICSIVIGLVNVLMNRLKVNFFFTTIVSAFFMSIAAYGLGAAGIADNTDTVVIGALMLLVPGLIFTNAMRDIIFGDTNSGINRIVQVLLVAAAIALGTGVAWNLSNSLWGIPIPPAPIIYDAWIQVLAAMVACAGFAVLFNTHGPGMWLCVLGGGVAWAAYCAVILFGGSDIFGYFVAGIVSAVYSESMARIRKYPAISYLVISIFPLIPGAGIYYSTNFLLRGNMDSFTSKGMQTIAIAGVIAVGILLVSTLVRIWSDWQNARKRTRNK